ncbi:acyl carrier protein [Legionella geestiana]|uniref:acyl carrier protein n=1 Tax=Legionella geestiana TaxID=45065 RepID=UPI001093258E|nr:acyl carrier protein [Legionella geestiana]QDQ39998.1 acyl carrier protein [Legionella geestiana]
MDKQRILLKLDEINELPPGTLKGEESTADWSSIVLISLIALADEEFNKPLKVSQLTEAKRVDDVVALLVD